MKKRIFSFLPVLILAILFLSGCTKNYIVLRDMDHPIPPSTICYIGSISDELPMDTPEEKKPTAENIANFKTKLAEELAKIKLFDQVTFENTSKKKYEVSGGVVEYKKGSGTLRFFIGFGAGNAKAVIYLDLKDVETGEIMFSANFTGTVSDWAVKGDKCFEQIAKSFAKQIQKRQKKLIKAQG